MWLLSQVHDDMVGDAMPSGRVTPETAVFRPMIYLTVQ